MRIFSPGVYLRRVAALTRLTKDLVCSLRSSAASALPICEWDTVCSFHEVLYPHFRNSHHLPNSRVLLPSNVSHYC